MQFFKIKILRTSFFEFNDLMGQKSAKIESTFRCESLQFGLKKIQKF